MTTTARLRFGLFEFDAATGELRREGTLVRLQPQPAAVLALLVAHAGDIVTRESIRDAVWGDDTFVDFDRGLNFCIAQIRAALGDTADSPRFIRTLPKRGYQFIAPVQSVETGSDPGPTPGRPVSEPLTPGRLRRRLEAAVLVVVLIAAGFAGGRWWTRFVGERLPAVAVLRFDNETASADFDRFADALTDTVVAQLTASGTGRYQVIGNAAILRRPREQRDLSAVGRSLGARYVVLGQVQRSGERIRVLAHLIRLPEQTHLWVTRVERTVADPLAVQLEMAERIAHDVTEHLPVGAPSSSSRAAND